MTAILLIAEHAHGALLASTNHALAAALRIGGPIDVLVIGADCAPVAEAAAGLAGVARVRLVDAPHYADQLVENLAMVVAQIAGTYSHVLLPASAFGKDLAPRVAAMLDVAQISDIVEVCDADTFVRPIYAGKALARVRGAEPVKVITVRMAAFPAAATGAGAAPIQAAPAGPEMGVTRLLRRVQSRSGRPDLSAARVVVAGGLGLGSRENFHRLLGALADRLGAALGASRAAVDANFVPNDLQVGQTGKVVAPELYIAVGLSGAIPHLAGMRDARVIVAINKDPEAPIFQVADYGLVGDLNEIVPRLIAALGG